MERRFGGGMKPLRAETTVDDGALVLVLIGDALKMLLEQDLDGARSSRLLDRPSSPGRAEEIAEFAL